MPVPTPNNDENVVDPPFIGNFHKTLPHNEYGEVEPAAYRAFERVCVAVEAGETTNFEGVPRGPLNAPYATPFYDGVHAIEVKDVAKFTNPLAGAATEFHGPDPKALEMPPAPGVLSISATAEMVELYWMALLRDAPLVAFQAKRNAPATGCAGLGAHNGLLGYDVDVSVAAARKNVNRVFDAAVRHDATPGGLKAPRDVKAGAGGAEVVTETLFRSGLHDEDHGPLLSQFFMHPVGYGVQAIDPRQVPYIAKHDFLIKHGDWLQAQNTGRDHYGRDYANCNNYSDQVHREASYYPAGNPRRYISTMRDLARFVNRDALHQAYFNAALFLDGIGAALDHGNPYRGPRYSREHGFGTLGGPDLLTLVSEVASRALRVVWRQKWLVHRRARPEVFGGLLQMQQKGLGGITRHYELALSHPDSPQFGAAVDETLAAVEAHNLRLGGEKTYFLPMAFSAGSPSHPAYGAGHATVAGACVTVLKAWFDEDQPFKSALDHANNEASNKKGPKDPTGGTLTLLQPGYRKMGSDLEAFCEPSLYSGADMDLLTVGGELNKLASNVAMGRSMGGVHWRSDNTRSLRLGEAIATEILRKRTAEYAERPVSFTFRAFDGHTVRIAAGAVTTL